MTAPDAPSDVLPDDWLPERLTPREAATAIGVCPRRLLTEFIRLGWLPYPGSDGCFARADVLAVIRRFDERRATP